MNTYPTKDPSEMLRNKLNSLPEKDQQGNYYRFFWQLVSYSIGSVAANSNNSNFKKLGENMKKGAKKSFVDYALNKIESYIDRFLDGNITLNKICMYCGFQVDSQSSFCPNCRNFFPIY